MRPFGFLLLLVGTVGGCGERGVPLGPITVAPAIAGPPRAAPVTHAAVAALPASAAVPIAVSLSEPTTLSSTASAPADPAPEAEPSIVLAVGGDVNLGRECGQAILKDPGYDPFSGLNAAWASADARFVNLESQLSEQHGVTQSPLHRLIFTGPPGGAEVLANAHVSLVSTANNHAWDYGKGGLLETIQNLERAQVPFAGTGRTLAQAYRPVVLHLKGRSVALFAVTQVWNQPPFDGHEGKDFVAWADIDKLKGPLEEARREYDFVLVSYHGGEEYVDAPVERTRRFVKAVMALGVDAFIGHHPHVAQGVGWVGGRPVVYSLGNFVFAGHDDRPWTKQSFFARLTLRKGQSTLVSACPFALDGHRPRSLDKSREIWAIERFRAHLAGTSTSVGGANVGGADESGCVAVTAKPPR